VVLTAASAGTTLNGTYTVAANQNTNDLAVASYVLGTADAVAKDLAGNAQTSTLMPLTG